MQSKNSNRDHARSGVYYLSGQSREPTLHDVGAADGEPEPPPEEFTRSVRRELEAYGANKPGSVERVAPFSFTPRLESCSTARIF